MNDLPIVIIMSGPSGAGKSTYSQRYCGVVEYCSADKYFIDRATGKYNFDASKLGEAHKQCFAEFKYACEKGCLNPNNWPDYIIVDNTNTQLWEMAPYVVLAKHYGFLVDIVRFESVDPKVCAARNLHGVPEKSIERMIQNMKYQPIPKSWEVTVIKV